MNKRALFGLIFWIIIIAILVTGTAFYFKFSKSGVSITTGDTTLNINYNLTTSDDTVSIEGRKDPPTNITNQSEPTNNSMVNKINLTQINSSQQNISN